MRRIAIVTLALAIGAPDARAQTPAQWSQLVAYVGRLAQRSIDQGIELERLRAVEALHREAINTAIGWMENDRCRINRLNAFLEEATKAEPTKPIVLVHNVACADLKSPLPPFPARLP